MLLIFLLDLELWILHSRKNTGSVVLSFFFFFFWNPLLPEQTTARNRKCHIPKVLWHHYCWSDADRAAPPLFHMSHWQAWNRDRGRWWYPALNSMQNSCCHRRRRDFKSEYSHIRFEKIPSKSFITQSNSSNKQHPRCSFYHNWTSLLTWCSTQIILNPLSHMSIRKRAHRRCFHGGNGQILSGEWTNLLSVTFKWTSHSKVP